MAAILSRGSDPAVSAQLFLSTERAQETLADLKSKGLTDINAGHYVTEVEMSREDLQKYASDSDALLDLVNAGFENYKHEQVEAYEVTSEHWEKGSLSVEGDPLSDEDDDFSLSYNR